MNDEQVVQFAEAARIPLAVDNLISRCVDGRYENIEQFPVVAKPGGDAGDALIAFGAMNILDRDLDHAAVFEAVIRAVGGKEKFNFHTDEHAENDGALAGMGCGHIKHAKNDPNAYGVKAEQINYIFEQLPILISQGANQEVLQGAHAEQAVVVVHSEYFGLKPLVRSEGGALLEAFIYQQTSHEKQLDSLARNLQEVFAVAGMVVEEPDIRKAIDDAFAKQLNETLQRLAKDLPVYTVSIDDQGKVELQ